MSQTAKRLFSATRPAALACLALTTALSGCGTMGPGLGGGASGNLAAKGLVPWAYLQVMAYDNPLSATAPAYAEALGQARSLPGVAPVVFVDEAGADDSYRLTLSSKGMAKDKITELDSASTKGVTDIFAWSMQYAPSQRRVLALSGHGGGAVRGMMTDEHGSASKVMTAGQLASVLRSQPVDILYLDACFSQSIETAFELQGVAEVVIGSESETFASAAPHMAMIQALSDTPPTSPLDAVATRLVQSAGEAYAPDSTLSGIRARRLNTLMASMTRLSGDLTNAIRTNTALRASIKQAMGTSQGFVAASDTRLTTFNSYRDLGSMLAAIGPVAGGDIQKQIWAILDDLQRNVMVTRAQGSRYGRATGISIYAPIDGEVSQAYVMSGFAQYTRWGEFLVTLNSQSSWVSPAQPDRFATSFLSRLRIPAFNVGVPGPSAYELVR